MKAAFIRVMFIQSQKSNPEVTFDAGSRREVLQDASIASSGNL